MSERRVESNFSVWFVKNCHCANLFFGDEVANIFRKPSKAVFDFMMNRPNRIIHFKWLSDIYIYICKTINIHFISWVSIYISLQRVILKSRCVVNVCVFSKVSTGILPNMKWLSTKSLWIVPHDSLLKWTPCYDRIYSSGRRGNASHSTNLVRTMERCQLW